VPGLIRYQFHWAPRIGFNNPDVRRVLRVMFPRLGVMVCIQLMFLIRDNLASRLAEGSVSALTYGWMIQQVPETILGTALGIALLPTISELIVLEQREKFRETVEKCVRILFGLTLPIAVVLAIGLQPLVKLAFGLDAGQADLLMAVTRGFLAGLIGHSILEVASRSFYSRQDAVTPFKAALLSLGIYIVVGVGFYRWFGAPGIAWTDSIAYTTQAVVLLVVLSRQLGAPLRLGDTLPRGLLGAAMAGGVVTLLFVLLEGRLPGAVVSAGSMLVGAAVLLPFSWKEVRSLLHL
jgi:putative peptidoglycan lipid II flippase